MSAVSSKTTTPNKYLLGCIDRGRGLFPSQCLMNDNKIAGVGGKCLTMSRNSAINFYSLFSNQGILIAIIHESK